MAHKYHAKRTVYDGVRYDSKREAQHAAKLDLLRKAKPFGSRVVDLLRQARYPLRVNDVLVCTYVADFWVKFGDGRVELHEVKGYETREWKLKRKLFEALYPDVVLKVIGGSHGSKRLYVRRRKEIRA